MEEWTTAAVVDALAAASTTYFIDKRMQSKLRKRENCFCACYNFYAWNSWLNNVIKSLCNAWTQKEFYTTLKLKIMPLCSV